MHVHSPWIGVLLWLLIGLSDNTLFAKCSVCEYSTRFFVKYNINNFVLGFLCLKYCFLSLWYLVFCLSIQSSGSHIGFLNLLKDFWFCLSVGAFCHLNNNEEDYLYWQLKLTRARHDYKYSMNESSQVMTGVVFRLVQTVKLLFCWVL